MPVTKRRRNSVQARQYGMKLTDLAGNTVSLADIALLVYAQRLCSNYGNFEHEFQPSMLHKLNLSGGNCGQGVIIDAFAEHNPLAVQGAQGAIDPGSEQGSGSDKDCD